MITETWLQIAAIIIPVVATLGIGIFNIRNGNSRIDKTNDVVNQIDKTIVGVTNPSINEIKTLDTNIASDVKVILDDVKKRQSWDAVDAGPISKKDFMHSVDKLFEQNRLLTEELNVAKEEIKRLQGLVYPPRIEEMGNSNEVKIEKDISKDIERDREY